jgi:hypothetical protein
LVAGMTGSAQTVPVNVSLRRSDIAPAALP